VVVGAGVAGLTAALGLTPRRVVLVTKARLGAGGASVWAQGGVAAAMGPDDDPAQHATDTLNAAAGIADPEVVELLTREGPLQVERLIELGARFDRTEAGDLAFGREAAHGRRRVLHAQGDATGAEMVRALTVAVRQVPNITVLEECFASDLVLDDGKVIGLTAVRHDGTRLLLLTVAVVLGTGGIGRVYAHTTNPLESTGDGLAMAARAGALLADLEFVQFHPTALDAGRDPMPLLTEALRGEGATLIDESGERFLVGAHPLAELAPRDVVARAIWRRQAAGHRVFLDATKAVGEKFPERFPTVFKFCARQGLDPRHDPIPVSPAAHYHMGGIAVDEHGRSSLAGLWAAGECSATGVHGANRLASNSLLEALVFGARVAEDLRAALPLSPLGPAVDEGAARVARERRALLAIAVPPRPRFVAGDEPMIAEVRDLMWREVGLERSATGLARALTTLEGFAAQPRELGGEAANLLAVGRLVARAALARDESRGGHYRSDRPEPLERWQHRLFWLGFEAAPQVSAMPLVAAAG
jgi:L-aspartate oxidase